MNGVSGFWPLLSSPTVSMVTDEDSAGRCTPLEKASRTDQGQQRRQLDGRDILGTVIAGILAGPLATTAVDIQSHLSTGGSSQLTGILLAGLIVIMVAAAAVGGA